MLRLLLILGIICHQASPSTVSPCPNGYTYDSGGNCHANFCDLYTTRNLAYEKCASSGAYLFDVTNAFQNSNLQQYTCRSHFWLGLTCTSNEKTSCVWDGTGRPITASSYTNFGIGSPNISLGPCVYMNIYNGMWYSDDCSTGYYYVGCRYSPGLTIPTCNSSHGYQSSPFRGNCYWSVPSAGSYSDAKTICSSNCGKAVSINSPGMNKFIDTLIVNSSFVYIGLTYSSGNYSWDDGSFYNYSNFQYSNPQMGSCVTMAATSSVIPEGTWVSGGCDQPTVGIVCEKVWTNYCDHPTTPIPPSTRAPVYCNSPQFFSGNGTLYSPGYPYGTASASCLFVFTVDEGQRAQIFFPELRFNSYLSQLIFYSDLYAKTPFLTLYSGTFNTLVDSPTNQIRMYFNSTYPDGSYWVANYGATGGACDPMNSPYSMAFFVDTTSNSSGTSSFYDMQNFILDGLATSVNLGWNASYFGLEGVASTFRGRHYQIWDIQNLDLIFMSQYIVGPLPDLNLDLASGINTYLFNDTFSGFFPSYPVFAVLFAQSQPTGSKANFISAVQNLRKASYIVLGITLNTYSDPTDYFVSAIGQENVFAMSGRVDSLNAIGFISRRACELKPS